MHSGRRATDNVSNYAGCDAVREWCFTARAGTLRPGEETAAGRLAYEDSRRRASREGEGHMASGNSNRSGRGCADLGVRHDHMRRKGLRIAVPMVVVLLALALAVAGCGGTASGASAGPTATPAPSPTPTTQPLVFFQDPLTAPDQYDWQNGAASTFAADGYHLNNAVVCLAPNPPVAAFADGTVSVQAKQVGGPTTQGYSLVFRAGGSGSVPDFYAFLIDGNGKWRAFKVIGGQATFFGPFTANPAIHTGLKASNTLQVVMAGSHFDFYVNGTKVGQANDSTLASGTPGLFGNVGIEVVFTNFRVQQTAA